MQVQGFVSDIGRTDIFASSAFGTGVKVQSLFPIELMDMIDPQGFFLPGGFVFQVQRFGFFMGIAQAFQENVGKRGNHMEMLSGRKNI